MQTPLKVFISHSTKKSEAAASEAAASEAAASEAELFLTAVQKAIEAETVGENPVFAVRVDRANLEFGKPWRPEINTWLRHCDAAVVLISQDALQSPFVAYEISVLCYRKSGNPDFCLLPLFLPGANFKTAEGSLLSPAQITELQPHFVDYSDIQDAVSKIVDRLKRVQASTRPPDPHTSEVMRLIDTVRDAEKRRTAGAELEIGIGPWDSIDDATYAMAVKLMSEPLETAVKSISFMRGPWWTERDLRNLLGLVASSWVDPRSSDDTASVPRKAKKERYAGLSVTKPEVV